MTEAFEGYETALLRNGDGRGGEGARGDGAFKDRECCSEDFALVLGG